MGQSIETNPNEQQHDIGNCCVKTMGDGTKVCMMNKHCIYALPFGNVCSHPMVGLMSNQISKDGARLK